MARHRIIFMGTPDFSVPALRAIVDAGHDVLAVYCQPPKPAGRGQQIQKTPVHRAAEELGIEVYTPKSLRKEEAQAIFAAHKADLAVVVAYGLILPRPVLDAPHLGCINIHGSLLPRWRGAAPIQRAILAGDAETGITIMRMEEGLDTGPMLLRDTCPIMSTTTAGSLHDALSDMGAKLIVRTLADDRVLLPQAVAQPSEGVTYAAKLTREDGRIDWTRSAKDIDLQIRGLQPWPGGFFMLGDEMVKVLSAEYVPDVSAKAGTALDGAVIAAGQGGIKLLSVQRAGKRPTDGISFLNGLRLHAGDSLP
ncbi:MAG: methionyl-tRNA formyltransferase [Alphaproteobacteria bacterium]|nr:methionyl-tRNA formyltransferase [Alphaproteobacteria bacterium]